MFGLGYQELLILLILAVPIIAVILVDYTPDAYRKAVDDVRAFLRAAFKMP